MNLLTLPTSIELYEAYFVHMYLYEAVSTLR